MSSVYGNSTRIVMALTIVRNEHRHRPRDRICCWGMLLVHRWPCTEIIVLWWECISNSGARWIASSRIELHHTVEGDDKLTNSRTVSDPVSVTEINLPLVVVEQDTELQSSKCSSFTFLKPPSTWIRLTQMVQINRLSRRFFSESRWFDYIGGIQSGSGKAIA